MPSTHHPPVCTAPVRHFLDAHQVRWRLIAPDCSRWRHDQIDPQAKVHIDRLRSSVQIDSSQPRDRLVQAITEEGYTVAPA